MVLHGPQGLWERLLPSAWAVLAALVAEDGSPSVRSDSRLRAISRGTGADFVRGGRGGGRGPRLRMPQLLTDPRGCGSACGLLVPFWPHWCRRTGAARPLLITKSPGWHPWSARPIRFAISRDFIRDGSLAPLLTTKSPDTGRPLRVLSGARRPRPWAALSRSGSRFRASFRGGARARAAPALEHRGRGCRVPGEA